MIEGIHTFKELTALERGQEVIYKGRRVRVVVIEGVLAETMDKQAKRITDLESQVRRNNQLEQRALRLSLKNRKVK